jgi:hypothetical protein
VLLSITTDGARLPQKWEHPASFQKRVLKSAESLRAAWFAPACDGLDAMHFIKQKEIDYD